MADIKQIQVGQTTYDVKDTDAYVKPNDGIPSSDMTSAVQTSLGKADTALQEHQDISGKEDKSNKVTVFQATPDDTHYPSEKLVKDSLDTKSTVSVSASGTATDEVQYITIDNVEKKLAGGGAGIDDTTISTTTTWSSSKMTNYFEPQTHITLTLAKSDSGAVNNVTVTVRDRSTGDTIGTYTYNNAPITITLPNRIPYKISVSALTGYVTPVAVTGTTSGNTSITMTYNTGVIYGFHINSAEADPSNAVTYLEDAVGLTPAHMDFENDVFEYGSWEDAFFMPKPCMLKYDGTVDYYLNPNDYGYRQDGTTVSDVTNTGYNGNAMMEWGQNGKKIWYKVVPDSSNATNADIYISDAQQDSDYKAWSFMDYNGDYIDHFYTPIYNGAVSGSYMRSMSGLAPMNSNTAAQEIAYATAQNQHAHPEWYTEVFCDIILINFLLILMSKSLNSQVAFGYGYYTGGSSVSSLLNTGTMNTKGMFWGSTTTGQGVKVFGMENWWGNQWRRYAGHMNVSNVQKYKMTPSTADGSTATGYNINGTGYLSSNVTCTGSSGGYITTERYISGVGMFPLNMAATSTTNYCDGTYYGNGTNYAFRSGSCNYGFICGAFASRLNEEAPASYWSLGSALSCKPLATV